MCQVVGFGRGMGKFKDPVICNNFIAYDDQNMGETYILVFVRYLLFGESLEISIVPPNQIISNRCFVGDLPKKFSREDFYMGYIFFKETSPSHV